MNICQHIILLLVVSAWEKHVEDQFPLIPMTLCGNGGLHEHNPFINSRKPQTKYRRSNQVGHVSLPLPRRALTGPVGHMMSLTSKAFDGYWILGLPVDYPVTLSRDEDKDQDNSIKRFWARARLVSSRLDVRRGCCIRLVSTHRLACLITLLGHRPAHELGLWSLGPCRS